MLIVFLGSISTVNGSGEYITYLMKEPISGYANYCDENDCMKFKTISSFKIVLQSFFLLFIHYTKILN